MRTKLLISTALLLFLVLWVVVYFVPLYPPATELVKMVTAFVHEFLVRLLISLALLWLAIVFGALLFAGIATAFKKFKSRKNKPPGETDKDKEDHHEHDEPHQDEHHDTHTKHESHHGGGHGGHHGLGPLETTIVSFAGVIIFIWFVPVAGNWFDGTVDRNFRASSKETQERAADTQPTPIQVPGPFKGIKIPADCASAIKINRFDDGETVYKIFYEGDTYKKIENGIVKFSYTAPCESNTLTDKATLTGYYYFWSGTGTTETIDYKWVK